MNGGVRIHEKAAVQEIWKAITSSAKIYELTSKDIYGYDAIIKAQKINSSQERMPAYDLPVPESPSPILITRDMTCWLKPIGTKENPIKNNVLHDSQFGEITFAVRPSGIKIGDIIICYAAHRKYIIAVYKAVSEYFSNNTNAFYPYSVRGENLFPYYGANWSRLHITIDTIKSEIISEKEFTITPKGANNYLPLTKADKMKVTQEYARLVMGKIEVENKRIAFSLMTD